MNQPQPPEKQEPDWEKDNLDLLKAGLAKSHQERFEMMMTLMRGAIMMQRAKITHYPDTIPAFSDEPL